MIRRYITAKDLIQIVNAIRLKCIQAKDQGYKQRLSMIDLCDVVQNTILELTTETETQEVTDTLGG